MVEKRCEPYPLFLTCYFPHTEQAVRRVDPALSLGRGRPFGVLFGQSPSLHALRRWFPTFVRALRRYSATVRLPTNVHAGGLRLRRVLRTLAFPGPPVLPSALLNCVGTLVAIISQLDTQPACAPVNASRPILRLATHDSGSGWLATPFLYGSYIHDSMPVYPGALNKLLNIAKSTSPKSTSLAQWVVSNLKSSLTES